MSYFDLRHRRLAFLTLFVNIRTQKAIEADREVIEALYRCSCPDRLIRYLQDQEAVTAHYGIKSLRTDLWYLTKTPYRNPSSRTENLRQRQTDDPLVFQIVVQALIDVETNRPCDLHAWCLDVPPDYSSCRPKDHKCAFEAENYLLNMDTAVESLMNVSEGCVLDVLRRIKKDSSFSMESYFPNG